MNAIVQQAQWAVRFEQMAFLSIAGVDVWDEENDSKMKLQRVLLALLSLKVVVERCLVPLEEAMRHQDRLDFQLSVDDSS